jgi:phosphohistidine phosphatase
MKRKIILVRHAQAQVEQFGRNDKDRILTMAGMHEVENVQNKLIPYTDDLQLILCSNAKRTRQTYDGLKIILPPQLECQFEDPLYNCTSKTLQVRLQRLRNDIQNVMIIAHNPGVSEFLQAVLSSGSSYHPMSSFPTAGVGVFSTNIPEWRQFEIFRCTLDALLRPSEPKMVSSF